MAAGKKLTPQQQRDRRSKIMLGVLGVVLLGVLAIQLPKLMGGGGGSAAPPAPVVSSTAGVTASPVSAPAAQQLTRFSRFAAKNPFKPGVTVSAAAASGSSDTQASGAAAANAKPKPEAKPKPAAPKAGQTLTISVSKQPEGPRVPAALLVINGKKHVLALDIPYPQKQPLFRVVALSDQAAWIQLVGGSLAGGQQTVKLDRGRKVTLENATMGLKFRLLMVKPTTAPKPATPPPTSTSPSPVVAPPTTTPSTTAPPTTTTTTSG